MNAVLIVLVVLLAIVAVFAVQNSGTVVVRFMTYSGITSLPEVVIGAFAAGVLSAGLAGLPGFFRRRREAATAAKRIRELEAEVGDLKKTVEKLTPPPTGKAQ